MKSGIADETSQKYNLLMSPFCYNFPTLFINKRVPTAWTCVRNGHEAFPFIFQRTSRQHGTTKEEMEEEEEEEERKTHVAQFSLHPTHARSVPSGLLHSSSQ